MDCFLFVFRDALQQTDILMCESIQIPVLMDVDPDVKGVVCFETN